MKNVSDSFYSEFGKSCLLVFTQAEHTLKWGFQFHVENIAHLFGVHLFFTFQILSLSDIIKADSLSRVL